MTKSKVRHQNDHGVVYEALAFVCPGCASFGGTGLHVLPITSVKQPSWTWDGNTEMPTLSPSILTLYRLGDVCHSFLRSGVFEFLDDCTHEFVGQAVPMPDLPEWMVDVA